MAEINNRMFSQNYLADIKNITFNRMDSSKNGGNGDGQVDINEAFNDLDIGSLLSGQNLEDSLKIMKAAENIGDALSEYAGEDSIFSEEEWANFINGDEWGSVLDAWHNSSKKAELEMRWINNAHIEDGNVTKGELKVGIYNNLWKQGLDISTDSIESLIDEYAGDDGIFTEEEYMALKQDDEYKSFVEKYNVTPWFNINLEG